MVYGGAQIGSTSCFIEEFVGWVFVFINGRERDRKMIRVGERENETLKVRCWVCGSVPRERFIYFFVFFLNIKVKF